MIGRETLLKHRGLICRMAGNIAAGMVSVPEEYTSGEIVKSSVKIAISIIDEVEEVLQDGE